MRLISKFNKGVRFLLCVIDIFSKYAWVVPLKDKKGASIVAVFQSILKQSNKKPNKMWVAKDSEFYNTSFKKWLQDNDTVMYSAHNEGKSVVAERFIRMLKNKIYKCMTSISKNVYIDKLDDIVNEYNNTYHTAIKIKPIDVKGNTYINTGKEVNDKARTFYGKELPKTNQKEFRIEKIIKKKGDKIYVKWKGYDNSFNSLIDEKDLVSI